MLGLLLAVLAGVIQGSFALPMKYTGRWKWEHTWSLWAVWALLILPWLFAGATVPHLADVYRTVPSGTLALTFAVSVLWGVGAVAFGFGVNYLGMSLGYAIIASLTTAFGSLIPLFMGEARVFAPSGRAIIAGVFVMMVGLALGARAGTLKEKAMSAAASAKERKPLLTGLLYCIVAGVGGSLMNIAFVVGRPIQHQAQAIGADPTYAPNAVWCISLLGGLFVNVGYCWALVTKNRDWARFREPGTAMNWLRTAAMGAMWFGSLALYGISSAKLGPRGPAMGFAIFLGTAILTSNLWGILTGEWKGTGGKPLAWMFLSIAVLLAGMGVIAWSKTLPAG